MNKYSLANTHLSLQPAVSTKKIEKSRKGICVQLVLSTWLILFWLCTSNSLIAQHPGFEMNYPGPHAESAWSMTETSDGGYVMTGFQGINVGQANVALRKVNAEGEELWVNYLGSGGSNMGYSIIENTWGNLVVAGRTNETTPPPSHHEAYLAELDQNGEIIWERTYPHPAGSGFLNVVKPTSDMGYVVAGGQVNLIGESSSTDVFVAKTDAMGDTLWTFAWGTIQLDLINDIFILPDESILCAGVTRDIFGFQEMLLLKLNNAGELLWLKTYDIEGHESARSIAVDSENNIILGGASDNVDEFEAPKICIVKTDSLGSLIWYKKYGGSQDDHVNDVIVDDEDNIYAVGLSSSYKPPGSPITGYAGFLKKLNTEGDSLWTRVFYVYEGSIQVQFYAIQPSPNDGFMICGGRNARMFLVRTDEWGCVEEGCHLETSIASNETEDDLFTVFPNPATNTLYLSFKSAHFSGALDISIFSTDGKLVHRSTANHRGDEFLAQDVSFLPSGMYLIQLLDGGQNRYVNRFVKQ